MKLFGTLFSTMAVACLAGFIAAGQPLQHSYDFVIKTNPYMTGGNAAALIYLDFQDFSAATFYGIKENGGLTGVENSPNSLTTGACAETFDRLSKRVAFYGKLSYSNFNGKDAGGQILMFPDSSPFNFLEDNLDTRGRKKRELYGVETAIAYSFNERFSAGFRVNYSSGDQTKTRDPRFSNIWMDANLSAGVNFRIVEHFNMGADFVCRNTIEQLTGGVFGTTDKTYFILKDRGWFYGTREGLGGDSGIIPTSNTDRRHIATNYYGGSLSANYTTDALKSYNNIKVLALDGYYGKRASTSPVYYEFNGFEAGYYSKLLIHHGKNMSNITLDVSFKSLVNKENSFTFSTVPGKSTTVIYTGQKEALNRKDVSANIEYTFYKGIDSYRPELMLGFAADFFMRTQRTTFYPFYRDNDLIKIAPRLFAEYSIRAGHNIFTPGIEAYFATGFGRKNSDGSFTSGSSTELKSFDDYMNRQYEYETAPRAGAGISFTYTRIFSKTFAAFVSVNDSFTSLVSEPDYLYNRIRNIASLKIGCNF